MKHDYKTIRTMITAALGAAFLTICAWISIPFGEIAITMQTFAVFLLSNVLGGKRTFQALCIYLLLGLTGLPVFTGFRGGVGVILGPTGGYIWGFLLCAGCGWFQERFLPGQRAVVILSAITGMLLCYLCGSLWYAFIYGTGSRSELTAIVLKCVLPYLIPDGIKITLALTLAPRIQKQIHV